MKNMSQQISGYQYRDAGHTCAHAYLLPAMQAELKALEAHFGGPSRLFDLDYGNGSVAAALAGGLVAD
jgi:hypothetical protein